MRYFLVFLISSFYFIGFTHAESLADYSKVEINGEGASESPVTRDSVCPHCQQLDDRENPAEVVARAENLAGTATKKPIPSKTGSEDDIN